MAVLNENMVEYEGNIIVLQTPSTSPIVDDDGNPLDLTVRTLKFALSKLNSAIDADPLTYSTTPRLEKTLTSGEIEYVNSGDDGLVKIIIATADTEPGNGNDIGPGNWYWELEGTDADSERKVLATGTITLRKNVVNT